MTTGASPSTFALPKSSSFLIRAKQCLLLTHNYINIFKYFANYPCDCLMI